eukprot:2254807-Karenia_brevis.AAC.2
MGHALNDRQVAFNLPRSTEAFRWDIEFFSSLNCPSMFDIEGFGRMEEFYNHLGDFNTLKQIT